MNLHQIARRSRVFHRRVNLAIALGVAAATAVLTGALIVGDSMRGSLRALTLDRLGNTDSLVTAAGFFRSALADALLEHELVSADFSLAVPVIQFTNGTAEHRSGSGLRRAGAVNVTGIDADYARLANRDNDPFPVPQAGQVVINQVLADDLGIDFQSGIDPRSAPRPRITLGVPRPKRLPSDSSLGDKDDLGLRLVDLEVVDVVPASGLGRFSLHPSQIPPRNAWVALPELQSALRDGLLQYKSDPDQANLILLGTESGGIVESVEPEELFEIPGLTLEDLGLSLRRVTIGPAAQPLADYFSLASDRLVISDEVANSVAAEFPAAVPLLAYLANDIARAADDPAGQGIPFSIAVAVDFDERLRLPAVGGGTIAPLKAEEIAITRWAAEDQDLSIGDPVRLTWFEPETSHGEEVERDVELTVAGIVDVTTPIQPFRVSRRGVVTPALFDTPPTVANDPSMTPEVPGLTDAESIERWDLPFATADRIRRQDDEYWEFFRTTPKAYVSRETGRRLWHSRFGETTSFRIDAAEGTRSEIEQRLLDGFRRDRQAAGLRLVRIRQEGLAAASGSTPFDALFLGLSLFVIAAALVLVSLLFRLALQQRSDEMGTMLAFGFPAAQVRRVWLMEMGGVCLWGGLLGVAGGVGYAAVMLYGLRTWWVGAVATPFLTLYVRWWTLPAGLSLGVVVCILTVAWSVRQASRQPVRRLLNRDLDPQPAGRPAGRSALRRWLIIGGLLLAILLTVLAATRLAGESQAGAFMTAGFLVLGSLLLVIRGMLERGGRAADAARLNLHRMAASGVARNPLRSTLTIGLVAVASFLILAISAFRLSPTIEGTAGFDYVATTSLPVFADLDDSAGQRQVLRGNNQQLADTSRVLSFRYKPGQDASCNNLYQSTQPRVLGVTPATVKYFEQPDVDSFSFSMTPGDNPWQLLEQPTDDGAIPVIIDKNTAWYSLKVYLPGTEFTVDYDSGESIRFRLVGLLNNSVLQGSLLVSEDNFTRLFPDLGGYRYFLMKLANPVGGEPEIERLADALSDKGFDARQADRLLAGFLEVQNTYLSTFQSLGFLGLMLGTFGLAAVQLRNILERRRELGVLRAVGFPTRQLARMLASENLILLGSGLAAGITAALITTLPHWFFGKASIPWLALGIMFLLIAAIGTGTSWLASRRVFRTPLLDALRDES